MVEAVRRSANSLSLFGYEEFLSFVRHQTLFVRRRLFIQIAILYCFVRRLGKFFSIEMFTRKFFAFIFGNYIVFINWLAALIVFLLKINSIFIRLFLALPEKNYLLWPTLNNGLWSNQTPSIDGQIVAEGCQKMKNPFKIASNLCNLDFPSLLENWPNLHLLATIGNIVFGLDHLWGRHENMWFLHSAYYAFKRLGSL